MTGEHALLLIAEISVGLAGFSGIVLVLARRQAISWDAWRTLSLLGYSFGALLLSLLPLALSFSGVSEPHVWRLASGAMALHGTAISVAMVRLLRNLDASQLPYYRPVALTQSLGTVLNTVVQLLNLLAFILPGTLAPFFWGLLWLILGAAVQFVLILFVRPRNS